MQHSTPSVIAQMSKSAPCKPQRTGKDLQVASDGQHASTSFMRGPAQLKLVHSLLGRDKVMIQAARDDCLHAALGL